MLARPDANSLNTRKRDSDIFNSMAQHIRFWSFLSHFLPTLHNMFLVKSKWVPILPDFRKGITVSFYFSFLFLLAALSTLSLLDWKVGIAVHYINNVFLKKIIEICLNLEIDGLFQNMKRKIGLFKIILSKNI